MNKKYYWGLVGLCFILVLTIVFTGSAQVDPGDSLSFSPQFIRLGLQYRFDTGWADQFSGEINPINASAFSIDWFRYNETEPTKTTIFHNHRATRYTVSLKFNIYNQTDRTTGTFLVDWFRDGEYIGVDSDTGILTIRDVSLVKRSYLDIIKARHYQYTVGDMD